MSKGDTLIKNTLIFSVGNFGSKLLSFLLIPLYTFYLTKTEFGYYDLILISCNLAIPLISFQLSDSVYRWLLDFDNSSPRAVTSIISSALFLLLLNIVIATGLFFVSAPFLNIDNAHLIFVFFISLCVYPFFLQLLRGFRLNRLYAICGILNTLLLVLLNLYFLVGLKLKVDALFWATIISNLSLVGFIIYKTRLWKYINTKYISKPLISELLRYSVPLIPNVISWWFISSANRYIILNFLGQDDNGMYALASRFPALLVMINSIFTLAWQESAITSKDSDDRSSFYTKTFRRYFVLEMSAVIVLIASTKLVFSFSVEESYFAAWQYTPILYVAVAFSSFSGFVGASFLAAKRTMSLFTSTIIGAIINIFVSYVLIQIIGLYGAAIGTLLGFLVTWLIRIKASRNILTIDYELKEITVLLVLVVVFAVFQTFPINIWWTIPSILFSIVLFYIYNKSLIVDKAIPVFKRFLIK